MNARDHLQARGGEFGVLTAPVQNDGKFPLEVSMVEEVLHG